MEDMEQGLTFNNTRETWERFLKFIVVPKATADSLYKCSLRPFNPMEYLDAQDYSRFHASLSKAFDQYLKTQEIDNQPIFLLRTTNTKGTKSRVIQTDISIFLYMYAFQRLSHQFTFGKTYYTFILAAASRERVRKLAPDQSWAFVLFLLPSLQFASNADIQAYFEKRLSEPSPNLLNSLIKLNSFLKFLIIEATETIFIYPKEEEDVVNQLLTREKPNDSPYEEKKFNRTFIKSCTDNYKDGQVTFNYAHSLMFEWFDEEFISSIISTRSKQSDEEKHKTYAKKYKYKGTQSPPFMRLFWDAVDKLLNGQEFYEGINPISENEVNQLKAKVKAISDDIERTTSQEYTTHLQNDVEKSQSLQEDLRLQREEREALAQQLIAEKTSSRVEEPDTITDEQLEQLNLSANDVEDWKRWLLQQDVTKAQIVSESRFLTEFNRIVNESNKKFADNVKASVEEATKQLRSYSDPLARYVLAVMFVLRADKSKATLLDSADSPRAIFASIAEILQDPTKTVLSFDKFEQGTNQEIIANLMGEIVIQMGQLAAAGSELALSKKTYQCYVRALESYQDLVRFQNESFQKDKQIGILEKMTQAISSSVPSLPLATVPTAPSPPTISLNPPPTIRVKKRNLDLVPLLEITRKHTAQDLLERVPPNKCLLFNGQWGTTYLNGEVQTFFVVWAKRVLPHTQMMRLYCVGIYARLDATGTWVYGLLRGQPPLGRETQTLDLLLRLVHAHAVKEPILDESVPHLTTAEKKQADLTWLDDENLLVQDKRVYVGELKIRDILQEIASSPPAKNAYSSIFYNPSLGIDNDVFHLETAMALLLSHADDPRTGLAASNLQDLRTFYVAYVDEAAKFACADSVAVLAMRVVEQDAAPAMVFSSSKSSSRRAKKPVVLSEFFRNLASSGGSSSGSSGATTESNEIVRTSLLGKRCLFERVYLRQILNRVVISVPFTGSSLTLDADSDFFGQIFSRPTKVVDKFQDFKSWAARLIAHASSPVKLSVLSASKPPAPSLPVGRGQPLMTTNNPRERSTIVYVDASGKQVALESSEVEGSLRNVDATMISSILLLVNEEPGLYLLQPLPSLEADYLVHMTLPQNRVLTLRVRATSTTGMFQIAPNSSIVVRRMIDDPPTATSVRNQLFAHAADPSSPPGSLSLAFPLHPLSPRLFAVTARIRVPKDRLDFSTEDADELLQKNPRYSTWMGGGFQMLTEEDFEDNALANGGMGDQPGTTKFLKRTVRLLKFSSLLDPRSLPVLLNVLSGLGNIRTLALSRVLAASRLCNDARLTLLASALA